MKRFTAILAAFAAIVFVTSCTLDAVSSLSQETAKEEIGIRTMGQNGLTKSAINGTAFPAGYDMMVSAYRNVGSHAGEDAAANYFTGIQFAKDATSGSWKSTKGAKYWPLDGKLDFLAVACAGYNTSANGIVPTCVWGDAAGNVAKQVVLTVPDNSGKFDDLLFGSANAQSPSAAGSSIAFKHAMTSVVFTAHCNVAYSAENNVGITIDGITIDGAKYSGTLTISNPQAGGNTSGADLSATWSGLGDQKDHISARVWNSANTGTATGEPALANLNLTTTSKTIAEKPFGEGYVILPEQATVPFTVTYTVHNGFASDGTTKVDNRMEYKYTPASGTWEMGKKYIYDLVFTLTEIQINPTVVDWNNQTPAVEVPIPVPNYLTFTVLTDGTITWKAVNDSFTKTIEYSKDEGVSWTPITSTKEGASITVSAGNKVMFRGDNSVYYYEIEIDPMDSEVYYNFFGTGGGCTFNASGNIMSLVAKTDFDDLTSVSECAFAYLFYNCTGLIDASGLDLSATTLANHCYSGLFCRCTNLTTAPALPATELASNCYSSMFRGCTSLTVAPALPATTLTAACYSSMFSGCTSLTTPPALPASTLVNSCYSSMFSGCTSLTTAPALPATTLANYCYSMMFSGCTSLTTAPALPATTLANYCYQEMFNNCTSLTTALSLPAMTLAYSCYKNMFRGCTSLTTAPVLPATTLEDDCYYCYSNMFYGCTSLTTAPALPATKLSLRCYDSMFSGCTSLTTAPALPATTLVYGCYQEMFNNCTSLTSAPVLPATTLASSCYRQMFQGCTNLSYIKAMFTTTPSGMDTYNWVSGVASTGTFVKNSAATWDLTGTSGVPSGWTVQTASE